MFNRRWYLTPGKIPPNPYPNVVQEDASVVLMDNLLAMLCELRKDK